MTGIRYGDGVEVDLATGETVVADASEPDGDVAVLSHAHGDHLYREPPGAVVCSELTARLAAERRDGGVPERTSHPAVELLNAGHVPGSRAALIDDGDRRVLYTGDVSTRERFYLSGFEPVEADVLVTETTYGEPGYTFPSQADLEADIVEWLTATDDRPVVLMGYSLGRAQELQLLARRAGRPRLFVSDAIADLNAVVADALGVEFGAERFDSAVDLGPGDALVLPSQTNHLAFVERLREETGALKAGFSGWAVDRSFRFRGEYDETFVLSDHCDFAELLDLVRGVDPEKVYTVHGATDAFATYLTRNTDYEAQALRRNQTSLGDF